MAETASTTVKLRNTVSVNGTTYPAGVSLDVPKDVAKDIERIDNDHTAYKESLMKKTSVEHNGGTMSVGGSE